MYRVLQTLIRTFCTYNTVPSMPIIRTALSGDRFFSSCIGYIRAGTLPSGFQLWDGGVDYSEDLDEEAELAIDANASNAYVDGKS